jgi:hypothetical protein
VALHHNYIAHEGAAADVIRMAERGRDNTGQDQWIHHHPEGHLCDHRCGPLDPPLAPDVGGGLTL